MCQIRLACLIIPLLHPAAVSAQDRPGPPAAALYAGLGHAFGGLGVRGEGHLLSGRLSALAGVGMLIGGEVENLEWAASLRGYAGSPNHRVFLDLSWTWLAGGTLAFPGSPSYTIYGAGLSVGYTYIADSGLTLTSGAGIGLPQDHREFLFQIGVGWTWRRSNR